jgi:AraC-like DNA-binding protein
MGRTTLQPANAPSTHPTSARRPIRPAEDSRRSAPRHDFHNCVKGSPDRVVAAEILNGYCGLVSELGGYSANLIREVGLQDAVGRSSGKMISLRSVGELLEKSAKHFTCPDFGLRLAERQRGLTLMKPLERLINHAPTMERSLRCTIDHMGAYSSGLRLSLLHDNDRRMHRLRFEILLDDFSVYPQLIECLSLLSHHAALDLTGGTARARGVSFSHTPIGNKWDYARRFSGPVNFDQDFDDVFFTDSDLSSHVVQHDEDIFTSEYEKISTLFPPTPLDTKARVSQAIRATLADSACGREEVCAIIGVSSRTLHRQLARIGTNFERLRDEVRRNLCLRYLARTDLTITQVAGRLGFSEGSVLTHACQKWFHKSPRELRRDLLR